MIGGEATYNVTPLLELVTYRYSRMDEQVERFDKSDKAGITKKWQTLRDAIAATLG